LLQNDKYSVDTDNMRQCFKRYFDREINTYLHIKRDFCDYEFLYGSQKLYFQKFYDCEYNAGRKAKWDYQTCRDVWIRNVAREEETPALPDTFVNPYTLAEQKEDRTDKPGRPRLTEE